MILKEQFVIEADKPNANGRIYPKEILEKIVDQYKENPTSYLGELGFSGSATISYSKVSHRITDMYLKHDILFVDVEILDTPEGKLLKEIIQKGGEVGFRTSGVGSIEKTDKGYLIDDSYKFVSVNAILKERAS